MSGWRVYRRDGSVKSAAQRLEVSSAASSAAQQQGSGTARSQTIYPGMKVTALGTVEFNGSTAKLSGATIFPAPASGAGSNATDQTAEEPYLSTLKEQLRTRALDTLGTESAALVLGTAYGDDSLMSSTARRSISSAGSAILRLCPGRILPLCFWVRTGWCWRFARTVSPAHTCCSIPGCSGCGGEARLILAAPPSLNNLPRQMPTSCRRSCTG